MQVDMPSLPDVLEDPSFAPGPGRKTIIVTSSAAPGPSEALPQHGVPQSRRKGKDEDAHVHRFNRETHAMITSAAAGFCS